MNLKNGFILIFISYIYFSLPAGAGTTDPRIVILFPPDNFLTNVSVITVSGEAEPGSLLSMNGGPLMNDNGIFSGNITLYEGQNQIIVKAQKNENISKAAVNVTLDTTAPQINIISPGGNYINSTYLNVTFASNDTDIGIYRVRLINQEWEETNQSYYLFNMTEGQTQIEAQAVDRAGNIAYASMNLTVDLTPPFIEIIKPTINDTIRTRFVEVTGKTEAGTNITVNGVKVKNNNGTWSIDVYLSAVDNTFHVESKDLAGNKAEMTFNIRLGDSFSGKMPYEDFFNLTMNFSRIGKFEENNDAVSGKYVSYLFDRNDSFFMGYSINNSVSATLWFSNITISNFKAENISVSGSIANYSQSEIFGLRHYVDVEIHDNMMGTMLFDIRESGDIYARVREYMLNRTPNRLRINVSLENNVTLEIKNTGTRIPYHINESWKTWPEVTFELGNDVTAYEFDNGYRLIKDNKEAYIFRARFAGGSTNFTFDGNNIIARVNNSMLLFRQFVGRNLTGDNNYEILVINGISDGIIGAEIFVDSAGSVDIATFQNLTVSPTFPDVNTLDLNVSSGILNGTVIVVGVGGKMYEKLLDGNLLIKYDGHELYPADNFQDIMDITNDFDHAEYLLTNDGNSAMILVSVPSFSSHVISLNFESTGSYGSFIMDMLNFLYAALLMALPASSRDMVFAMWWFVVVLMVYFVLRKAIRKRK